MSLIRRTRRRGNDTEEGFSILTLYANKGESSHFSSSSVEECENVKCPFLYPSEVWYCVSYRQLGESCLLNRMVKEEWDKFLGMLGSKLKPKSDFFRLFNYYYLIFILLFSWTYGWMCSPPLIPSPLQFLCTSLGRTWRLGIIYLSWHRKHFIKIILCVILFNTSSFCFSSSLCPPFLPFLASELQYSPKPQYINQTTTDQRIQSSIRIRHLPIPFFRVLANR